MKIYTSIEQTFKKRPDGLYQEFNNYFIHIIKPDGTETVKLDKQVRGKIYKEDNEHRSVVGETFYTFQDDGLTRRLIAL